MGEGSARAQPAFAWLCAPPLPLHGGHTGCTLEHSTFQSRPRSHATAHALPVSRHKHPQTGPCGPANAVGGRRCVETLSPAPTPPRQGAAHFGDSHALPIFFLHPTSHMDFTNATRGPECHIPPDPRTCGHKLPTHLGLALSPGAATSSTTGPSSTPSKKTTHIRILQHTPSGVAETSPRLKG